MHQPHPNKGMADNGRTLYDYADYVRKYGGASAESRLLAIVKALTGA